VRYIRDTRIKYLMRNFIVFFVTYYYEINPRKLR
jgi:hypothetical protein